MKPAINSDVQCATDKSTRTYHQRFILFSNNFSTTQAKTYQQSLTSKCETQRDEIKLLSKLTFFSQLEFKFFCSHIF